MPNTSNLVLSGFIRRLFDCHRVTSFDERKKILATKKLCFNCTGPKHRAIECNSKISCRHCAKKHHTSICDRQQAREPGMTTSQVGNSAVIHPVVIVKVLGYKYRALLDSGASHSYASSTFVNLTTGGPHNRMCSRLLFYSKCTGFTVCFTYSDISLTMYVNQ